MTFNPVSSMVNQLSSAGGGGAGGQINSPFIFNGRRYVDLTTGIATGTDWSLKCTFLFDGKLTGDADLSIIGSGSVNDGDRLYVDGTTKLLTMRAAGLLDVLDAVPLVAQTEYALIFSVATNALTGTINGVALDGATIGDFGDIQHIGGSTLAAPLTWAWSGTIQTVEVNGAATWKGWGIEPWKDHTGVNHGTAKNA